LGQALVGWNRFVVLGVPAAVVVEAAGPVREGPSPDAPRNRQERPGQK
jgi:hypothetical protein